MFCTDTLSGLNVRVGDCFDEVAKPLFDFLPALPRAADGSVPWIGEGGMFMPADHDRRHVPGLIAS